MLFTTRVLQMRPTSNCAARCATCATTSQDDTPNMTLREVEQNLDYFIQTLGVDELVLAGGEVTMREDFPGLIEAIARRKLRLVTIHSNGQNWTPEHVRASAGVVHRVVIGFTPPNRLDWSRLDGLSNRTIQVIERLQRAGITVQTNTVPLRANVGFFPEIARILRQLQVFAPTFTFLFPFRHAPQQLASLIPSWADTKRALFAALDLLEPLSPKVKNLPPCYLGEYARFSSKTTQRILVESRRQFERHAVIPPFVGMEYFDPCNGCALRPRCDGFWRAYLDSGMFPPLAPVLAEVPPAVVGC